MDCVHYYPVLCLADHTSSPPPTSSSLPSSSVSHLLPPPDSTLQMPELVGLPTSFCITTTSSLATPPMECCDYPLLCVRDVYLRDDTSSASERPSLCTDKSDLVQDPDITLQMSEFGLPTSFCTTNSHGKGNKTRQRSKTRLQAASVLSVDALDEVEGNGSVCNGTVDGEEVVTFEASMVSGGTTAPCNDAQQGMTSSVIINGLSKSFEGTRDLNGVTSEEVIADEISMESFTKQDEVSVPRNVAIVSLSKWMCLNSVGSSGKSDFEADDQHVVAAAVLHNLDVEGSITAADEGTMLSIARVGMDSVLPKITVEPSSRVLDAVEGSTPEILRKEIVETLHHVDEEMSSNFLGNGLLKKEAMSHNGNTSREMAMNEVTLLDVVELSESSSHEANGLDMVSSTKEPRTQSSTRMALEMSSCCSHGVCSLDPSKTEITILTQETTKGSITTNASGMCGESFISTLTVTPEVAAYGVAILTPNNACEQHVIPSYEISAEGEVKPFSLWVPYWDEYYSRYYFYNTKTLETTWDPPEGFGNYSFEIATEDSSEVSKCCNTESVVLNIIDEIIESVVMSKSISEPKCKKMSRRQKMKLKNQHSVDNNKESVVSDIIDEIIESVIMNNSIIEPKCRKMSRRQKKLYALHMGFINQYTLDENKESVVSDIVGERAMMSRRRKKLNDLQMNFIDPNTVDMGEHSPTVFKYWVQRYRLFSKFDAGVKLDEEGWFSVTPEAIAKYQAARCNKGVIIDAFTGVGGNAIQFALAGHYVIAIDNDPRRIEYAHHNAMVYGVADRIDFIVGDFFALSSSLQADIIFLSPPWGGPEYLNVKVYDVETMLQPRGGTLLFKVAQAIAPNVMLFLPRNVGVKQLAELSSTSTSACACEVERMFLNGKLKAITAYYGKFLCVRLPDDTC